MFVIHTSSNSSSCAAESHFIVDKKFLRTHPPEGTETLFFILFSVNSFLLGRGNIFSPHTQNRCCRAQLCSPPEQNTSESFSQILIDRQGDYQVKIIIRCRLVSAQCTAAGAAMRYDIALFRVRLGKHRFKRCAALGRAITRIFVNMERPEAVWAMISRGVAERRDLSAAMLTDKSAVVL